MRMADGHDRVFVIIELADEPVTADVAALQQSDMPSIGIQVADPIDLGAEFYRWEIATATAGAVVGIDDFDQPNVQESKDNTKALLKEQASTGKFSEPPVAVGSEHFELSLLSGSKSLPAAGVDATIGEDG